MAIIESSVWLLLTLAEALRFTHPPTGEIKFLPGQFTSKPFFPNLSD